MHRLAPLHSSTAMVIKTRRGGSSGSHGIAPVPTVAGQRRFRTGFPQLGRTWCRPRRARLAKRNPRRCPDAPRPGATG